MKNALISIVLVAALFGCDQGPGEKDKGRELRKAAEAQVPSGRVLRYGIFSKVRGGEIIEDAETSTGKAMSNLVMTFIKHADRIPIKKGTLLGYQYRLSNIPVKGGIDLRRVLKHPEFKLPDGFVSTGSDYTVRKKVERNEVFAYDVYGLDETYEMVEGEWTFQIWYEGKKLTEQKFTTYWPEEEESSEPANEPEKSVPPPS